MTGFKVSVVVATYCPGQGLDRLMASLDAQSLPADEWEMIFVDDGSPDNTVERLRHFAADRPTMRVERIENSGWPCRPRNIGTELATGEYIAYMDHDDELYPDALRDGWTFAKAHDADVLNGKEARTHDPGWAIDTYRQDSGQVKDHRDAHPLVPTNPHKLYRRAFLNEHGIRFREGGRVLWEDIYFNVLAARYAKVIATMASTPYYHWYTTPGSGSTSFRRSRDEWWDSLDSVIRAIDTDLAEPGLETQRKTLRQHQYRSRLMDSFNNLYERRSDVERARIFDHSRTLQERYFPVDDDECLHRNLKMRAQLLRRGAADDLLALTVDDPNIPARPRVDALEWVDGTLRVNISAEWEDSRGRRFRHVLKDGRVVKDLPARYDGLFEEDLLDVTDDLDGATIELGMRSKQSRITWMAPTQAEAWREPAGVDFGVRGTGVIDPRCAAMGKPLESGVWELNARCTLGGVTQHRMLPGAPDPAILITETAVAAAYRRGDGKVVLDLDQTGHSLAAFVEPTGHIAQEGVTTVVEVSGVPTDTAWSGQVRVAVNTEPVSTRIVSAVVRTVRRALRRKSGSRGWHTALATLTIASGRAQIEVDLPTSRPTLLRLGHARAGGSQVYVVEGAQRSLRLRRGWWERFLS